MCRYSMSLYKPHYACFECRKTFKRRLKWDINRDDKQTVDAKCPQCGQLMADMGLDFAAPKMSDIKEWAYIKTLYSVGITFHSCGCTGPGYIPNSPEKLRIYYEELIKDYQRELTFWRQRQEPQNNKEIQREQSKYWHFLNKIPKAKEPKNSIVKNGVAIKFWLDKIKQVENKILTIAES